MIVNVQSRDEALREVNKAVELVQKGGVSRCRKLFSSKICRMASRLLRAFQDFESDRRPSKRTNRKWLPQSTFDEEEEQGELVNLDISMYI